LHAYANNYDFDMARNGERWLLQSLSQLKFKSIVDVGANHGDWIQHSLPLFSHASIYAVEPVPSNFGVLSERFMNETRVSCFQVGLGSKNGSAQMETDNRRHSHARIVTTTANRPELIDVKIQTGDDFLRDRSIDSVDFLKIDAEGYDCQILQGLKETLSKRMIDVIQFEYTPVGYHYDMSLEAVFELLQSNGYVVGRLFPKQVKFGKWNQLGDPLFGVNYLAINQDREEIIQLVSA
jgi:FkbM family methyltransferase